MVERALDHLQILQKVTENPHLCPHCDSVLILKEGRDSKFFACPRFPECRYTTSLAQYRTKQGHPYCEKCKGEQKFPLKNKEGKVIPFAWVFCDCHPQYGTNVVGSVPVPTLGRRPPSRGTIPKGRMHLYEDDFNFAMSYDFHRFLCWQHGWPEPTSIYPTEPMPQVIQHIHRTSDMSKREFDLLEQTKRSVDYLEKELNKFTQTKRVDKQDYDPY